MESKYSHLEGGGKTRMLFHVYPENFYSAVRNKGTEKYLAQLSPQIQDKAQPPQAHKGFAP
jgi:hypothetical protein